MSKRTYAISALVLVIGLAVGWLAHSPNTSAPKAATAIGAPVNDSIGYWDNGDNITTEYRVNVEHLDQMAADGSALWVTEHFTDNTRTQQVAPPTFLVVGTTSQNMICTAAHVGAMPGSDHRVKMAADIQGLCDDFKQTAASGDWISCVGDMNKLLVDIGSSPINPQPIVDNMTNGQAMALCNHSVNAQDVPVGYNNQLWETTNASVFN